MPILEPRCPKCFMEVDTSNSAEVAIHYDNCDFRHVPKFLVLFGVSDPDVSDGIDGNYFINTNSKTLFGPRASGVWPSGVSLVGQTGATGSQGSTGATGSTGSTGGQGSQGNTGAQGSAGSAGADGNTLLYGTSDPVSGTGVNGNFYINYSTSKIFGPKASGAWPSGVPLIGPTGATGATGSTGATGTSGNTLLNGSGAPSSGTGNNGDFYLDTTAHNIYGPKTAGAWGSGLSIIGAVGAPGAQGATGSTGATGSQGSAGATGATGGYAGVTTFTSYGAGTAYNLTATSAAVTMGTTSPSIAITTPGTYLLLGRSSLKYNAATFLANQTATMLLHRTNNTPVDLSNTSTVRQLRILTILTDAAGLVEIPPTIYTTANSNDTISLFGSLSATPTAGNVQVTECDIQAIRIA